jgi:acyl carrier protein
MISDELKRVILAVLELDEWEIGDETIAAQIPGWDSLKHVSVIIAVEEHFNIRFNNIEILRLKNVGDLQHLVDVKIQKKGR